MVLNQISAPYDATPTIINCPAWRRDDCLILHSHAEGADTNGRFTCTLAEPLLMVTNARSSEWFGDMMEFGGHRLVSERLKNLIGAFFPPRLDFIPVALQLYEPSAPVDRGVEAGGELVAGGGRTVSGYFWLNSFCRLPVLDLEASQVTWLPSRSGRRAFRRWARLVARPKPPVEHFFGIEGLEGARFVSNELKRAAEEAGLKVRFRQIRLDPPTSSPPPVTKA